ncbi:MAG: N4-gp56 family major capsid protein [Clostridia bacterium]
MAINYMDKHAAQIDEAFAAASVTDRAINKDYDFTGVRTVKVHSVPTIANGDYTSSGSNRYGTPDELGDNVQELTLVPDRAFTFTVDKGNSDDDAALNSAAALRRQIDKKIVPEVDKYRFATMAVKAGNRTYGVLTGTGNGPYERVLEAGVQLDADDVPAEGRMLFMTSTFHKKLKLDTNFIKASDVGQGMLIKGQIGEVDNMPVFKDRGRLPEGVDFLICISEATTAPWKLSEYRTHIDPPGINGVLIEGRNRYDAFVLNNKKDGLCIYRSTKIKLTPTNAMGASGKTKFTAVTGATVLDGTAKVALGTLCYAISAGAIAAADIGMDISNITNYPELTFDADITCAASDKYRVYLKDADGKLIGESDQGTVARGA